MVQQQIHQIMTTYLSRGRNPRPVSVRCKILPFDLESPNLAELWAENICWDQARIHHWGWVGMHTPPPAVPEKIAAFLQVISSK